MSRVFDKIICYFVLNNVQFFFFSVRAPSPLPPLDGMERITYQIIVGRVERCPDGSCGVQLQSAVTQKRAVSQPAQRYHRFPAQDRFYESCVTLKKS